MTDYLTSDFLADFRQFAYRVSRAEPEKYAFAVIDMDDEQMFNYLTELSLGRFDSPGVFAFKDISKQVFYRNYEIYNGRNFRNISESFVTMINEGLKKPLYAKWIDSYRNLENYEYWWNNKMKSYIYIIGLVSVTLLPIILLVDCFFPLLGRGTHIRKPKPQVAETKEKKE